MVRCLFKLTFIARSIFSPDPSQRTVAPGFHCFHSGGTMVDLAGIGPGLVTLATFGQLAAVTKRGVDKVDMDN